MHCPQGSHINTERRHLAGISVALTLTILFLAIPAAATLRLMTDSPRGRVFKSVYDMFPTCWKALRPVLVREVTDEEMDMLVGEEEDGRESEDDSVVDGYYQPGRGSESPIITLRRSIRDTAAEMVFAHEYAHYIWDHKLSERQRGDYARLWNKLERSGGLVTEYAADSVEEGFSEAVSYYVLRPSVLKRRDEQSFRFVQALAEDGMRHMRKSIEPDSK